MLKSIVHVIIPVIILCFASCNENKNIPDVSDIRINLTIQHFDQDLFAIDTNNVKAGIVTLQQKYPTLSPAFFENILGLPVDSLLSGQAAHASAFKMFLRDYRPLKDSADKLFGDFTKSSAEIQKGLQFVKYYFPQYKSPQKIYTLIGPIDALFETSFGAHGDIITEDGLGVALQFHMGDNFSFYQSSQGQAQFPEYIRRRLTPETIPVNAMKNIVDDMFPDKSSGRPLIEQIVEKGKRLYLVDRFLPKTPGHLKIGYSEKQLEACYENEAVIWNLFVQNYLLNNAEQNMIKNYIGDSPKTQELGEDSPGNIGAFCGWQIVKKFMDKNPDVKPGALMKMDSREVYSSSKYRPK